MRKLISIITLTTLILFGVSCFNDRDTRLEQALSFAGDNRSELEKVLMHYTNQPERLEAAKFLIRNMPRWYGYSGWQLDSLQQYIVKRERREDIPQEEIQRWNNTSLYSLPKVFDAHVITSEYLIENIELAFEVREKYAWNQSLSFEDFCELILPYRIGDESLSSWRRLYYDSYSAHLDSMYQGTDVVEACNVLTDTLRSRSYYWNTELTIPHQKADFLFNHRMGYCRDVCDFTIYTMRACGIPVASDFFTYSPEYQNPHYWSVLRDTTGKFLQFGIETFNASRDTLRDDGRKRGKVYRYCYGWQEESIEGITMDENVPVHFRNRFIKDVTSDYYGENIVNVEIDSRKDENVYLAIFSPRGWLPIDVTQSEKTLATFKNIEPNCIYQALTKKSRDLQVAGYPFVYVKDTIHYLKPNEGLSETIDLTRKMPLMKNYFSFLHRAVLGARIEASIDSSFKDKDVIWEFTDTLHSNYNELLPEKWDKKFRFIKYCSPKDSRIEFADIMLYKDAEGQIQIPLKRISDLEPLHALDRLTDGNILSFFESRDTNCFIKYDLGVPTPIEKIIFYPRNDDNFIWPGDEYELFYQNGTAGWVSLGRKMATDRTITFSAPKNALLWLRNLTKGREEQVFVYRNGRQYFAYDIDENFPLD